MKKIPAYGEQGSKMKIYDIVESIEETISNSSSKSPSWRLPNRIEDSEEYVALLIYRGLIQMQEDHCYYCPIPS